MKSSRGFTLIELMIVLVIIGVIVSFATLSLGNPGAARLSEEARRIAGLLEIANQEAVLQTQELALATRVDGYEFLVYQDGKWQPLEGDDSLRPRTLPADVRLSLEVDDAAIFGNADDAEAQDPNRVYLLSSGEMTPFHLTLLGPDKHGWQLKGDLLGQVALSEAAP